jgi:hypothetical protein
MMKPMRKLLKYGPPALFAACLTLLIAGCGGDSDQGAALDTEFDPANAPEVLPATLEINNQKKTYVISGIGLSGSNKVAIINNEVVQPGAAIDNGVILKDVQPTYAIIVVSGKQYLLRPEDIQRQMDKQK